MASKTRSTPAQVKMVARHLLREVPRSHDMEPRELVRLSQDLADFSDVITGYGMRMAASQLLSGLGNNERVS